MPVMLERWNDDKMDALDAKVDGLNSLMREQRKEMREQREEMRQEMAEQRQEMREQRTEFGALQRTMVMATVGTLGIFITGFCTLAGLVIGT